MNNNSDLTNYRNTIATAYDLRIAYLMNEVRDECTADYIKYGDNTHGTLYDE